MQKFYGNKNLLITQRIDEGRTSVVLLQDNNGVLDGLDGSTRKSKQIKTINRNPSLTRGTAVEQN